MFTGIIESIGTIGSMEGRGQNMRLSIDTGKLDLADVKLGDSIATNGVCLTVIELLGNGFAADVSFETLKRTSLGELAVGSKVNLEKAMRADSRFGGHIVSGHVDDVGTVSRIESQGDMKTFWIQSPKSLLKYIAEKGSITVDGTSLTVNEVVNDQFRLTLVPHSLKETVFEGYQVGSRVNLEVDVVARYVERLITPASDTASIDEAFLAKHGYLK